MVVRLDEAIGRGGELVHIGRFVDCLRYHVSAISPGILPQDFRCDLETA